MPTKQSPTSAPPSPIYIQRGFNSQSVLSSCASISPLFVGLIDGRCLPISTARCWEFLSSTAQPPATPSPILNTTEQRENLFQRHTVTFKISRYAIPCTQLLRHVQSEPSTGATWPGQWWSWKRGADDVQLSASKLSPTTHPAPLQSATRSQSTCSEWLSTWSTWSLLFRCALQLYTKLHPQ